MEQSTKRALNNQIAQLKIQIDEEAEIQQNYLDLLKLRELCKDLQDSLSRMKEKNEELRLEITKES